MRFFIVFLFILLTIQVQSQVFDNKELLELKGDYQTGQILCTSDGYFIQITKDLENEEGERKVHLETLFLDLEGKILWLKELEHGCGYYHYLNDFFYHNDKFVGVSHNCPPQLFEIDKNGNILRNQSLDTIDVVNRMIVNENNEIVIIGQRLHFEGFFYGIDEEEGYFADIANYYQITFNQNWDNIHELRVPLLEFEQNLNDAPISINDSLFYYFSTDNSTFYIYHYPYSIGERKLLQQENQPVHFSNYLVDTSRNFTFCKLTYFKEGDRTTGGKVEIISINEDGKVLFTTKVSDNIIYSGINFIRSRDNGFIYEYDGNITKLDSKGKIIWKSDELRFKKILSITENSQNQLVLLVRKEVDFKDKVTLVFMTKKGVIID